MSHFLIFLWINWKEECVHPCGHFLWFLTHGLFGLFMVSVVNLVCFGFVLFHEVSLPCPFLPLVCCLLLKRNNLILGTVRASGLYFTQYFIVHPLQGHLWLSWPWGIQCLCSCVNHPCSNSSSQFHSGDFPGHLWDVFMERFEAVDFVNHLSPLSSSSSSMSDPPSPASPQQDFCDDVEWELWGPWQVIHVPKATKALQVAEMENCFP